MFLFSLFFLFHEACSLSGLKRCEGFTKLTQSKSKSWTKQCTLNRIYVYVVKVFLSSNCTLKENFFRQKSKTKQNKQQQKKTYVLQTFSQHTWHFSCLISRLKSRSTEISNNKISLLFLFQGFLCGLLYLKLHILQRLYSKNSCFSWFTKYAPTIKKSLRVYNFILLFWISYFVLIYSKVPRQ